MRKFNSLKEIHEYFAVNNNCKLKESATQPVYETTLPKSGIVFIGEAPGLNEDKQGKPFVGQAGKLLDELLKGINLSRDDVYVSNTVKYRPPKNRDPLPEEKESCRLWLNTELIHINPSVIVTLGRHALETFLPGMMISKDHGKIYEHRSGIPVYPIYHPAAALYNPNLKKTLVEDFKNLSKYLKEIKKNRSITNEKEKIIEDILKL